VASQRAHAAHTGDAGNRGGAREPPDEPQSGLHQRYGRCPVLPHPVGHDTNIGGELLAFAGAYCQASTDGCDAVGPRAKNMTHGYVAVRKSTDFGSTWGTLTEVPGTAIPCGQGLRTHADVIWDGVRNATVVLSQHQRVPCCRHPWEQLKPIITMTKSTDSGATWAASVSPLPGLKLNAFVSPGGGIQLQRGAHAGRLISVAQTPNTSWTGPGDAVRLGDCASHDCDVIFFSDDGGDSWRRATPTIERNDEASLVELTDGTLLMSLWGATRVPPST
jgi:hypothetical protein